MPVGDGDGAGDSVGDTDGGETVGLEEGPGVGPGDSVGDDDGAVGCGDAVGIPNVGFGVGDREMVGVLEGEGLGFGESVGDADGSLSDGAADGDGVGIGESVGAVVAAVGVGGTTRTRLDLTVGCVVGLVVGDGVLADGASLGLGEGAGVGNGNGLVGGFVGSGVTFSAIAVGKSVCFGLIGTGIGSVIGAGVGFVIGAGVGADVAGDGVGAFVMAPSPDPFFAPFPVCLPAPPFLKGASSFFGYKVSISVVLVRRDTR